MKKIYLSTILLLLAFNLISQSNYDTIWINRKIYSNRKVSLFPNFDNFSLYTNISNVTSNWTIPNDTRNIDSYSNPVGILMYLSGANPNTNLFINYSYDSGNCAEVRFNNLSPLFQNYSLNQGEGPVLNINSSTPIIEYRFQVGSYILTQNPSYRAQPCNYVSKANELVHDNYLIKIVDNPLWTKQKYFMEFINKDSSGTGFRYPVFRVSKELTSFDLKNLVTQHKTPKESRMTKLNIRYTAAELADLNLEDEFNIRNTANTINFNTNSNFNPSILPAGAYQIRYCKNYWSNNNVPLKNTGDGNVQLFSYREFIYAVMSITDCNTVGSPTINNTLLTTCETGALINLEANNGSASSVSNIRWSGNGVVGATFNPSLAGVGKHTITYSVMLDGCTKTATKEFEVKSNLAFVAGSFAQSSYEFCNSTLGLQLLGTVNGSTTNVELFQTPTNIGVTYNNGGEIYSPANNSTVPNGLYTVKAVLSDKNIPSCQRTIETSLNYTSAPTLTGFSNPRPFLGSSKIQLDSVCVNSKTNLTLVTPDNYTTVSILDTRGNPTITTKYVYSVKELLALRQSPTGNTVFVYNKKISDCLASLIYTIKFIDSTIVTQKDTVVCKTVSSIILKPSGTWLKNNGSIVRNNSIRLDSLITGLNSFYYQFTAPNGCTSLNKKNITANALPSITPGPTLDKCITDKTVKLNNFSPTGGSWSLNSVVLSNDIYTFTTSGSYDLVYKYTDANRCSNQANRRINVYNLPVVNAGSDFKICVSDTIKTLKTGTPSGGTWSGRGVTNGKFSPAIGRGNFNLTYTFSNAACIAKDSLIVFNNPLPVVDAGNDVNTCQIYEKINLRQGLPKNGKWVGVGIISDSIFQPNTFQVGTYKVSYTFRDTNNCFNIDSTNINVRRSFSNPSVTSDKTQICKGGYAVLQASVSNEDITTNYNWYRLGENRPFIQGKKVLVNDTTDMFLFAETVTSLNDGCPSLNKTPINIYVSEPNGSIGISEDTITSGVPVQFFANVTNGNTFLWTFSDKTTSTETNPYHYFYNGGSFDAELYVVSSIGCSKLFKRTGILQVIPEKIDEVTDYKPIYNHKNSTGKYIAIYPTLVENDLFVELISSESPTYEATIFDVNGNNLRSDKIAISGKTVISVEGLRAGYYLLRLKNDNEILNYKFIKK